MRAYVYGAKLQGAWLAELLGESGDAERLRREAETLRRRFDETFWIEELGTYAMALDGKKKLCRVHNSNAGQVLMTGLTEPERARRIAQSLMSDEMFSGWGIRTVAAGAARYNPMSYHNGLVWPHDHALIAIGLSRYGFKDLALKLLAVLFEGSLSFDLHRVPELYCGFPRRPGEGPTLYPVACSPQAWSAGTVFMMLRAALGIHISAPQNHILISDPRLPEFVERLRIGDLRVGDTSADLLFVRHGRHVSMRIPRKDGPARIVTVG